MRNRQEGKRKSNRQDGKMELLWVDFSRISKTGTINSRIH